MLYLGERIFSMHENMEFFAICEKVLEKLIPSSMVVSALEHNELDGIFFDRDSDRNWQLSWPSRAPEDEAVKRVDAMKPLRTRVCARHSDFLELLFGTLEIDPAKRLSAATALEHQFFMDVASLRD